MLLWFLLFSSSLSFIFRRACVRTAQPEAGGPTVSSCRVVVDRATGRGKGFGYVEFAAPEGLAAALQALQDRSFMGRALRANVAAASAAGPAAAAVGAGVRGGPHPPPSPASAPAQAGAAPPSALSTTADPVSSGAGGMAPEGGGVGGGSGPEPAYFFDLGGSGEVVLVEVLLGHTFAEGDLSTKARRLLFSSGGSSHALCKVTAAPSCARPGGKPHGEYVRRPNTC